MTEPSQAAPANAPVTAPEVEPVGYILRRPLVTDLGDYLLFITRPQGGVMGMSSATAIFACDSVAVDNKARIARAFTKAGDIFFSSDLPFLVVPRTLARPVTTTDLAKIQVEEKKEWDQVMDAAEPPLPVEAVRETADGRLSHDSQGYL